MFQAENHPQNQPNQLQLQPQPNQPENEKISPKAYSRLKRHVIRTEHDNYDSIYVLPCAGSKGWHEIGDHSALFFYYDILKDHLKKPKFIYDTYNGFYNHYEFGRISIRSLDNIIHALDEKNIKYTITTIDAQGRHTTSPIHITRFRLPTYSGDTLESFIRAEKSRREQSLRVPRATDLMPDLYLSIIRFATILQHLVNRNFNTLPRAHLATAILNETNDIVRKYLEISYLASLLDTKKNPYSTKSSNITQNPTRHPIIIQKILQKYLTISKELDNLHITLQMCYAYQYIDVENCCVIQDTLTSIKEQISVAFKQTAKNHTEQNQTAKNSNNQNKETKK